MKKQVLACIDGSIYSKTVVQYAKYLAQIMNLPVKLLHVIEHENLPQKINLSGNIGLGARDDLLESLSSEEAQKSKDLITKGREALNEAKKVLEDAGIEDVELVQRHGLLDETIEEMTEETKICIIGVKGDNENYHSMGKHVEDILRLLHIPILLVREDFKAIDSLLLAYDGSKFAQKALMAMLEDPMFPYIKRHVVNVSKDKEASQKLLQKVHELSAKNSIEIITASLEGEAQNALLEYQKNSNIDLFVMGAFSHNRFRDAIFGSFTSKILQSIESPILLFR